ncbi:MAG: hypothetical protein ABEH38_06980 [Flavobacteriales bacterium]
MGAFFGPLPFLFWVLLFGSGCEVIDPKEKTPSFIKVQNPTVKTDPSIEGSNSHDIQYGWVYVDDQLQGVYELPAKVLTSKSGVRNVKVRAGIHENGIIKEKIPYPFYRTFSMDTNLRSGKSTVVEPEFRYYDQQDISIWVEDFNNPNTVQVLARPSSDTLLEVTQSNDKTFEGAGSGKIPITNERDYFLGASDGNFQFDVGNEVFLELDYKTSDTLNVGLLAKYPQKTLKRSLVNLNATRRSDGSLYWNKVYIRLTPIVGEESEASEFEVFIQSTLQTGVSQGTILIDNFKVLYQDG